MVFKKSSTQRAHKTAAGDATLVELKLAVDIDALLPEKVGRMNFTLPRAVEQGSARETHQKLVRGRRVECFRSLAQYDDRSVE